MENTRELRRSFGGKINGFKDKQERAFEQKHLKAYTKGHKRFRMGLDDITREPNWFPVKEVWS